MAKVLTTSIAAVTLLASAKRTSSANPQGFTRSPLNADQLIEQRRPDIGRDRPVNERMTTELFGLGLTAIFAGLLILNAISF